jgi:hypothetical protein
LIMLKKTLMEDGSEIEEIDCYDPSTERLIRPCPFLFLLQPVERPLQPKSQTNKLKIPRKALLCSLLLSLFTP